MSKTGFAFRKLTIQLERQMKQENSDTGQWITNVKDSVQEGM